MFQIDMILNMFPGKKNRKGINNTQLGKKPGKAVISEETTQKTPMCK